MKLLRTLMLLLRRRRAAGGDIVFWRKGEYIDYDDIPVRLPPVRGEGYTWGPSTDQVVRRTLGRWHYVPPLTPPTPATTRYGGQSDDR